MSWNKIKTHQYLINSIIVISFILLSFMDYMLLIHTHSILGQGDIAFHFRRVLELKESILHGDILPKFSFNQYHGSLIMSLYPYMNLYPISILSIFIKSNILLLYLWYISNTAILLILCYYCSYLYNNSIAISYLFSIIYGESAICFSSGLDDFGLITAFAFLPLIMFGCFNLVNNDKYVELSLGMAVIISCHVLSAFISFVFIVFWILLNIKEFNVIKFLNLLKAVCLTICLTSFVWIPVFFLKLFDKTKIFTPTNSAHYSSGISIVHILGGDLLNNLTFHPNIFAFIGMLLLLIFYKKFTSIIKKIFWLSAIFMAIGINFISWKQAPSFIYSIFKIFQGPGRFLIMPQILLSYALAIIIIKYCRYDIVRKTCTIATIFIVFFFTLLMIYRIFNTHQFIYLLLLGVLIICISILIFLRYSKHLSTYKIIAVCMGMLAVIFQMDVQQQVINEHIQQGHIITSRYYYNHIYYDHPASWLDRITKPTQFKYLISFLSFPTYDYYPKSSIIMHNYINNNIGFYSSFHKMRFRNDRYNNLIFRNNANIHKLALPLLGYKGFTHKIVSIKLDNHYISYGLNRYNMITINNVKRGNHNISIKTNHIKYINISLMLYLIGILWLLCSIDKSLIANHKDV